MPVCGVFKFAFALWDNKIDLHYSRVRWGVSPTLNHYNVIDPIFEEFLFQTRKVEQISSQRIRSKYCPILFKHGMSTNKVMEIRNEKSL